MSQKSALEQYDQVRRQFFIATGSTPSTVVHPSPGAAKPERVQAAFDNFKAFLDSDAAKDPEVIKAMKKLPKTIIFAVESETGAKFPEPIGL